MDREYKSSLRCLKIGDKVAELPIIQGGMGVGVSRSSLAGAVAAEGGVGVISTAQIGYDEAGFEKDQAGCNLKAIRKHIWMAREIAKGKGLVGVNIMVAPVHLRSRISFFSYAIHLLFLTVCSLRFLLQNAGNRLPFSFIPLSEHTALPATHPTVREIRSRLLYTGASVPTFLCCTARPGR